MFNKYHKAKLKTKQQRWFTPIKYLILSILPLTIDFALKSISKNFKEININFEVPNFLFELALLWFLLFFMIAWYLSPFTFSKVQRIRSILKRIIEENHFYYKNDETNKIHSSMIIKFNWDQEYLILEVYPEGAKYSSKMSELTPVFQTALNMTVISVQEDFANHTTYILSKETDNYIDSTNTWTV
ncbi:hypothetical protein [Bacillus cereus group sp. BfR-BA-01319]|uniref:hypothetical protein n=1 Tax=Bacillus cereus group sp. BfR-BA-01319 TaxID=2920296 RepID=UPI001F589FA6|nr:hypothetical protein [Bacillus cereus group sp. BfR-BA-01319]